MASPREELQQRMVDWLFARRDTFNAPYGILDGKRSIGKGFVREITFGRCRTLDAHVTIWSPTKLVLKTNRGDWVLQSEQEFYDLLREKFAA